MAKKANQNRERVSKKEQRQQELSRKKKQQYLLIGVPAAILLLGFIGLAIFTLFKPDVEGLLTFGSQSRNHDLEAAFAQTGLPPTGGTHNPSWQNCGIYETAVDDSLAVHSLEHGAVWVAYHPDLPADQVEYLRDLARGESNVLMSPYPDLTSEVVLSGWSKQLVIDTLPDERIAEFIDQYQGQGPESGASCQEGLGTPIE